MERQDAVHGAREHGADFVFLAGRRIHHMQEVFREAQLVAGIDEGLTKGVFIGPGGDRRHLGDQAVGRDHPMVRIVDVGRVVIERRQGADHAAHHRHRVGVAPEPAEEVGDLLVQHRVIGDVFLELALLLARRQFAVEQQVADLHEVGMFGQVLNRNTAIQQDARVTVDVGDLGLATAGRCETRVVGKAIRFRVEFTHVDDGGADAGVHDRQFIGFAVTVVRQGEGGVLAVAGVTHTCPSLWAAETGVSGSSRRACRGV